MKVKSDAWGWKREERKYETLLPKIYRKSKKIDLHEHPIGKTTEAEKYPCIIATC